MIFNANDIKVCINDIGLGNLIDTQLTRSEFQLGRERRPWREQVGVGVGVTSLITKLYAEFKVQFNMQN